MFCALHPPIAPHRDASSGRIMQGVGVPLLLINAADDPICDYRGIPLDKVMSNPNVRRLLHGASALHAQQLLFLQPCWVIVLAWSVWQLRIFDLIFACKKGFYCC
jgi:hypothetical protein